jgi:hypothetical protein
MEQSLEHSQHNACSRCTLEAFTSHKITILRAEVKNHEAII